MNEKMKLENKMAFYLKNSNKEIMTEKDEEDYRSNDNCRFCEKNNEADKVRDQFHLTGMKRGPAHSKCKINVIQKQIIFFHLYFTFLV